MQAACTDPLQTAGGAAQPVYPSSLKLIPLVSHTSSLSSCLYAALNCPHQHRSCSFLEVCHGGSLCH